jgi:hypothetical protein
MISVDLERDEIASILAALDERVKAYDYRARHPAAGVSPVMTGAMLAERNRCIALAIKLRRSART